MTKKEHPVLTTPAATACGNCSMDERRLLHHVRHLSVYRRLCTSCVLRLHPQAFCPSCFVLHQLTPSGHNPNPKGVNCSKCSSVTHLNCVGPKPPNPFKCLLCVNPYAPIFGFKKPKEGEAAGNDNHNESEKSCWTVDQKKARILLTAATIAANSMTKSAQVARVEAEKRAKEAAFARKRAREALEHVGFLMMKEKLKQKEMLLAEEVSGYVGNVGVQAQGMIVSKGDNVYRSVVAAAAAAQNRISNQGRVDRLDGSSEVLAAFNAVELREKEKLKGFKALNATASEPSGNGVAMMDIDSNEGTRTSPGSSVSASVLPNNGSRNEKFGPGEPGHSEFHDAELQNMKNNHVAEDNIGSKQ